MQYLLKEIRCVLCIVKKKICLKDEKILKIWVFLLENL